MILISLRITKCVPYAIFSYFMRKEQMSSDKIFRFCTKCSPILAVFKHRYNRCSNKD